MTGWLLHRTGVNQVVAEGEVTRLSANNGSERDAVNPTPETKDVGFETRIHDLASAISFSKRSRAIARIADGMNAMQIRQALKTLKSRSVRDADQIRLRLIERWAELEPEAALRYAEALSQGGDAQRAIPAVIRVWGAQIANLRRLAHQRLIAQLPKRRDRDINLRAAHELILLLEVDRQRSRNLEGLVFQLSLRCVLRIGCASVGQSSLARDARCSDIRQLQSCQRRGLKTAFSRVNCPFLGQVSQFP
jgi:hypothetical protein